MTKKEKLIRMQEMYPNCPIDRMIAEDDPDEEGQDDGEHLFTDYGGQDEPVTDADAPVLECPIMNFGRVNTDQPKIAESADANGTPILHIPVMNFEKKSVSKKNKAHSQPSTGAGDIPVLPLPRILG